MKLQQNEVKIWNHGLLIGIFCILLYRPSKKPCRYLILFKTKCRVTFARLKFLKITWYFDFENDSLVFFKGYYFANLHMEKLYFSNFYGLQISPNLAVKILQDSISDLIPISNEICEIVPALLFQIISNKGIEN